MNDGCSLCSEEKENLGKSIDKHTLFYIFGFKFGTVNYFIFASWTGLYFAILCSWSSLRRSKFAMNDVFWCIFYTNKYFARIFDLLQVKFVSISENKILANRATENRFFAGLDRFLVCKTDSICIKCIFFGPKKHTLWIIYWPNYLDKSSVKPLISHNYSNYHCCQYIGVT